MDLPNPQSPPTTPALRAVRSLKARMVLEGTSIDFEKSHDPALAEAVLANGARAYAHGNEVCAVFVPKYSKEQVAALRPYGRCHVQGEDEIVFLVEAKRLHEATTALKNARPRKP